MLEYATLLTSDELIRPEHLRLPAAPLPAGAAQTDTIDFHLSLSPEELSLDNLNQKIMEIALQRCGGNKSRAASLLKISRKKFYR